MLKDKMDIADINTFVDISKEVVIQDDIIYEMFLVRSHCSERFYRFSFNETKRIIIRKIEDFYGNFMDKTELLLLDDSETETVKFYSNMYKDSCFYICSWNEKFNSIFEEV